MNPDETLDAPAKDRARATPVDRDAIDIVEGDVGNSRVKLPGDTVAGVDVDQLEKIVDAQDDPSDEEKGADATKLPPPR